ncbi:tail fiber domain-containing protein [Serratia fonticola]|uniref:tail fiber domain-containing protein n=1 Tax=Serratia fonticola TaxID=47917 RepID=UPI00217B9328|nr:tail fiber domain-containing protein [Serratia fonticola]CAI1681603.1 Uncharacterised protein [Serratia fonticola]
MPAGTITLTNNSVIVKGAGTALTAELKPGDMIVSVVGGVTYTLPVKTADNATQVALIRAYDGPTQAGVAWSAVPRDTLNAITAQLAAEASRALRGLNLDKDNWQQVFSGKGNVTVKLPDGSSFTGPAWNSFTSVLNEKATKSYVDEGLNTKANSALLGNSASRDVGTAPGTVAAGNDPRITNAMQTDKINDLALKNQGKKANQNIDFWQFEGSSNKLKSRISVSVGATGYSYLSFMSNRPVTGSVMDVSFSINGNTKVVSTESAYLLQENGVRVYSASNPGGSCDIKFKENIKVTPDDYAIPLIDRLKFVAFDYKENSPNAPKKMSSSCGLIAQELDVISDEFTRETTGNDSYKYPDLQNLLNLALKAIQEQQSHINELKERVSRLES